MTVQTSLFEPIGAQPIETSLSWIEATVFGSVATVLCVLAVAFVGALMLTGRLPVRQGFLVVIGCFVLLGAPLVAQGIVSASGERTTLPLR